MATFTGQRDGRVVKIEGDDWLDVAELVDLLDQEEVRVELANGDSLRFKTARERACWAEGMRFGLKAGTGPERILRVLEAGLEVIETKDTEARAEAVEMYERLERELTESELWRKNEMSRRLKSWNLGSTTTSSTEAKSAP